VEDEWGIRRRLTSASTESRIIYHPLKDASADSLDDYPFPDPYAPGRFNVSKDEVEKWKENYVVAGGFGVDTGWLHAWQMRGFTQFTVDLYANPEFVEKLLDKLFEYYQGILKQEVDLGIEMVRMLPDDVATQTGMIISPKMWRKYLKPRYKKLIASVKPKVKYVLFHSDGNYEPIMPDLIEVGVNIFNPIQPDCMDIEQLKNQYGDKVTLWGGLSVQDTLPHGTVDDVKAEVKRTIEICAPGGGFVLGTSNNITQDTPVENFLAIYEVAKKYGRYPISTS